MRTIPAHLLVIAILLAGQIASPARAENWPHWRGPAWNGSTSEANLPNRWSKTENVAWIATLPGPSGATPVIWDDSVFLPSPDADGNLLLLCIDSKDGKFRWQRMVTRGNDVAAKSNMTAPSAVTDGKRVVVMFGTGDVAAYDFAGKQLWSRNLAKPYDKFALLWLYSSSPLLFRNRLFIQVLQRAKPMVNGKATDENPQRESFLLCLDPQTGNELWRHIRTTDAIAESQEAYTSPVVRQSGRGAEIIIFGADCITSHQPETGAELWRSCSLNAKKNAALRTIASPVAGPEGVFACLPRAKSPLVAIAPNRPGDVAGLSPTWQNVEAWSDVSSPLYYRGKVFVLNGDRQTLTCVDPITGATKWKGALKPTKSSVPRRPGPMGRFTASAKPAPLSCSRPATSSRSFPSSSCRTRVGRPNWHTATYRSLATRRRADRFFPRSPRPTGTCSSAHRGSYIVLGKGNRPHKIEDGVGLRGDPLPARTETIIRIEDENSNEPRRIHFMSLAFTNVLEADVISRLQRRFPPFERLFDCRLPTVLYPAGRMARAATAKLLQRGVAVAGFGDGNSALWGSMIDGLPVLSPQEILQRHSESSILVATSMFDSELCEMFRNGGCQWVYPMPWLNYGLPDVFISREYQGAFEAVVDPRNHHAINAAYELLADDESRRTFAAKIAYLVTFDKGLLDGIRTPRPIYFDRDIMKLSEQEVVCDGGAFTGDTLSQFLDITQGLFCEYHAFEPDAINFDLLQQKAATDPERIHPLRAGLAKVSGQLQFLGTSGADATFAYGSSQGSESLPVVSIDQYFAGRKTPTFIKMDIEGFEKPALLGATRLIVRNHPVLAVSAYHYPCDLWEIPNLIHELSPEYRMVMRHYTREIDDTVCYAIPPERMKL